MCVFVCVSTLSFGEQFVLGRFADLSVVSGSVVSTLLPPPSSCCPGVVVVVLVYFARNVNAYILLLPSSFPTLSLFNALRLFVYLCYNRNRCICVSVCVCITVVNYNYTIFKMVAQTQMYLCIRHCVYIYTCKYLHIHTQRERERERTHIICGCVSSQFACLHIVDCIL